MLSPHNLKQTVYLTLRKTNQFEKICHDLTWTIYTATKLKDE